MNVAYYSPCWPPGSTPNGIASYLWNVLNSSTLPFNHFVFSFDSGALCGRNVINLSATNFKLDLAGRIAARLLPASYRVRACVRGSLSKAVDCISEPIDILEIEESRGMLYGARCKFSVVTRLHGPWFMLRSLMGGRLSMDDRYRMIVEGKAIRQSSGVTSPSRHVLESVRNYYGCELPFGEVIPNPVMPTPEELRWNGGGDFATILYVGRFDRLKGADVLLKAFRLVAIQNKDAKLLFVGPDRGLIEDGRRFSFPEYLAMSIPEPGIRDRVCNLGGLPPKEIALLRRSATVTVVSSRYENFSLSLIEAMSAGCPVVATAVGGMKEIVEDGVNGILIESESPDSMAAAMLRIIDDSPLREALSVRAVEHCTRHFHPDQVAQQLYRYYRGVLSRKD